MSAPLSFLHLIHRVGQIGAERFASEHAGDLRPRQLEVLRAAQARPGCTQTALVDATGIDRSTMADIIRRLVERRLLRRRRSRADTRAYIIELTAEGSKAVADAGPTLARVEAAMLAAVPETDRIKLIETLERMTAAKEPTQS